MRDGLIDGIWGDDHARPGELFDFALRDHVAGTGGEQLEDFHVLRIDLDDLIRSRQPVQCRINVPLVDRERFIPTDRVHGCIRNVNM